MASFEQHVNIAVIATGIIIVPLYSSGLLDSNHSLIALGLGLLGGMLPDLDSDNSKPIQIVFKMLSIFLPLIILLSIAEDLPVMYLIVIWLASTLILHLTLFKIFLTITSHRGIFHSIPMGILFGLATIFIFNNILNINITLSSIFGCFIFFGFIVHLLLDELFSVNALGLRMKKSFGTALKVYDKNNIIGSLILYIVVIIMFFMLPIDNDIYTEIFNILKDIKII